MTDISTGSVVDYMAQPSHNHEPTTEAEPTVTMLDGDEFWRKVSWGVETLEPDAAMGRVYALVGGRWYATELDVA